MLIQKSPSKGEIVSLLLTTGQEIVGRLHDVNEKIIRLDKPVVIITQMVSDNQAQIGFMPYMSSVDETLPVPFTLGQIVSGAIATKGDISNMYRKMTSSIEVPKSTGGLIL